MPKVKQSFSEPSDPHNVPHSNLISQPYSFEPHVSSWFDNWCWANRLPQTHPFYPRPLSLFSHLSAHFTFSFLFFRASRIPLFPHPHTPFIVNANLVAGLKHGILITQELSNIRLVKDNDTCRIEFTCIECWAGCYSESLFFEWSVNVVSTGQAKIRQRRRAGENGEGNMRWNGKGTH